jgi:predicted amidohydrolase
MRPFKIAAAQVPSVRGDIAANVSAHEDAIRTAATHAVSLLVFPELSLTGYELDLAARLAFSLEDDRVSHLRDLAQQHQLTLVVGAPMETAADKPAIGAFVLTPNGDILSYLKMHLGSSESDYCSPGIAPLTVDIDDQRIGLSICADSSRPSHARAYSELGAQVYAAGVFLTDEWYETDAPRLQKFAQDFQMLTVMANQGASTGTYTSVGKSAIWEPGGTLLVRSNGVESVLLTAARTGGGWRGEIIDMSQGTL